MFETVFGKNGLLARHYICPEFWRKPISIQDARGGVFDPIPDGVTGIHCHNPSGRTMAQELTQK
jgi:hypothetical protein